jgi:hypothetical protein
MHAERDFPNSETASRNLGKNNKTASCSPSYQRKTLCQIPFAVRLKGISFVLCPIRPYFHPTALLPQFAGLSANKPEALPN